jgi:hypothetical protein
MSRGAAVDDTPREGCPDCTRVRAEHGESGLASMWRTGRGLLGPGAVGRLERRSATAHVEAIANPA